MALAEMKEQIRPLFNAKLQHNQRTHNACENVNELRVPNFPNEKAHTEEFQDSQQNNQLEEKVSEDQRGNLASRNPHGSTRRKGLPHPQALPSLKSPITGILF